MMANEGRIIIMNHHRPAINNGNHRPPLAIANQPLLVITQWLVNNGYYWLIMARVGSGDLQLGKSFHPWPTSTESWGMTQGCYESRDIMWTNKGLVPPTRVGISSDRRCLKVTDARLSEQNSSKNDTPLWVTTDLSVGESVGSVVCGIGAPDATGITQMDSSPLCQISC